MNQIRFTNLNLINTSSAYGQSFLVGLESEANPTNPTAIQGIDEVVLNQSSGTIAQFRDSTSMSAVFNDNGRAYSFVI